jgi:hypothetical protein
MDDSDAAKTLSGTRGTAQPAVTVSRTITEQGRSFVFRAVSTAKH